MPVPRYLSDDLGLVLSNPDPDDVRIRYSRHLMFNLTRPEKSLILLAPLAKRPAGYGTLQAEDTASSRAVFADTSDPDYQTILALCREGKKHLDEIKRFDMPGFRPSPLYVREMRRYGILDRTLGERRARSTSMRSIRPTGVRIGGSPARSTKPAFRNEPTRRVEVLNPEPSFQHRFPCSRSGLQFVRPPRLAGLRAGW